MENKDKPAFLNVETCPHTGGVYTLQPGLTKEEYIATRLMQELVGKRFFKKGEGDNREELAKIAVNCSEALLKEIEKRNN